MACVLFLGLVSCTKEEEATKPNINAQPQSFEEITVSNDFSWTTVEDYTLELTGLNGLPFEVVNRLKVKDENGKLVYQRNVKMGQTQSLKFKAAAPSNIFTIEYGSVSKQATATGNTLRFNFLPPVDNSDLDQDNL